MALGFLDPRKLLRTPGFVEDDKPMTRPRRVLPPAEEVEPPPFARPPVPPINGEEEPTISYGPRIEPPKIAPLPMPTIAPTRPPGMEPPKTIAALPSPIRDYRGNQISDEVGFAKDQFMRKGGEVDPNTGQVKFKRGWKNSLGNAALGALSGIGATGSLGGALGGAISGGVGATISPRMGRERMFDAFQRPQIEESMARGQAAQDRERQALLDELKRRDLETRARMGELELEDFPAEMESRRAERAARVKKLEQPPTPRQRRVFVDAEGNYRDQDTGQILTDPGTKESIKGVPTGGSKQGLMNVAGQGIYDPNKREYVERFPEKPDRQQQGQINRVENDLARLEREARSAWAKWGQFKPGADLPTSEASEQEVTEKERLKSTASAAQEAYINAALQAAQRYPDQYDVSMDQNGWPVIRRKQGGVGQSQPGGGKPSGPTAKLSDLKNKYLR